MGLTERLPRRRLGKIIIAALLVAGVAAWLNSGLRACSSARSTDPSRPLSQSELSLLASMRQRNYGDGRVGIRGTVGQPGKHTSVNGWIDWRRSLIYLSVSSQAQGSVALVQARPGIIAIRPETNERTKLKPPQPPPSDGWRVRPISLAEKEKTPLDNLLSFLFLIARDQPDRQDLLGRLSNQWVRKDTAQGTEVDVLLGPAVLPETEAPQPTPSLSPNPSPPSLDTYGGAVGYWLDADGRLRKVEALLGTALPASIDFLRDDHTVINAVDALGGRDIAPSEVTDAEAEMLSLMRQRNFHARYSQLAVTLPAMPGTLRTGTGWLDWQRSISYVSIVDADDAAGDSLVHANKTQVARRKPEGRTPDKPPIPAPKGGWERTSWTDFTNGDATIADIDVMLYEVMSAALNQRDDVKRMKSQARRLRVDVLNGVPMGVFELPNAFEQKWDPGNARVRYWLDNSGVLRRLEIRTGTGGFAQLDLTVGVDVPSLPSSVL